MVIKVPSLQQQRNPVLPTHCSSLSEKSVNRTYELSIIILGHSYEMVVLRYEKGRPFVGSCREKNHDNHSTLTR